MVFGVVGSALLVLLQTAMLSFCWVRDVGNDRRSVLGHMPWVFVELLQGWLSLHVTPDDTRYSCSSKNNCLSFALTLIFALIPGFMALRSYITLFHCDIWMLRRFFRGGFSEILEQAVIENSLVSIIWFGTVFVVVGLGMSFSLWPQCTTLTSDGIWLVGSQQVWPTVLFPDPFEQYQITTPWIINSTIGADMELADILVPHLPEFTPIRYVMWCLYGVMLVRGYAIVPTPDCSLYVMHMLAPGSVVLWLIFGSAWAPVMISIGGLLFCVAFVIAPFKLEKKFNAEVVQIDVYWTRQREQHEQLAKVLQTQQEGGQAEQPALQIQAHMSGTDDQMNSDNKIISIAPGKL